MLPNSKEFLHKPLAVGSPFTDFTGKLSIPSLFSFFQEVAWEHATLNGFGYEHLKDQGFFWVLSRVNVEISNLPEWTEKITLSTWPSGTEGPFALRDFSVFNNYGDKIIGATSSWLIVDQESRRPRRPDTFKERMPICDSIRATNGNAPKLASSIIDDIYSYSLTTRISDIDVNGHINNTKYIEWALNSLPMNVYKEFSIKSIAVNFLSEGFCDEPIEVRTSIQNGNNFLSIVSRVSDNKQLAIVQFLG